jgi:hypothetical protein
MGGGSKKRLEGLEWYLESWLLIMLHGNQRSMCRNLSLLVSCLLFFLSLCFGFLMFLLDFISSLPQLAWEKGFDVVVVIAVVVCSHST